MKQQNQGSHRSMPRGSGYIITTLVVVVVYIAMLLGFRVFPDSLGVVVMLLLAGIFLVVVPVLVLRGLFREAKESEEAYRNIVRMEDHLVVERTRRGRVVGRIDPSEPFRVDLNPLEIGVGIYTVTQGDQKIRVGTWSPHAEYILRDVLKVRNWPPDYYLANMS